MPGAVAIVGVGRHGRRLLDILLETTRPESIDLVDPSAEARVSAIAACREKTVHATWHESNATLTRPVDLAIVTTPTAARFDNSAKILSQGCRTLVLEKTYAAKKDQLANLVKLSADHGSEVYGGLVHRRMPYWRRLKATLDSRKTGLCLQVNLGAVGLVTDGIHMIDLFVYLTNATALDVENVSTFAATIQSPRGEDLMDFGANITLRAQGTEHFMNMAISPNHNAFGALSLVCDERIVISADIYSHILETQLVDADPARPVYHYGRGWCDWTQRPATADEFAYFDLYAKTFSRALDGADDQEPALPTLQEGLVAHEALFTILDQIPGGREASLP